MKEASTRPSIPAAIASILLVAGLATTALVVGESPGPFATPAPTEDVAGATSGPIVVAASPTPRLTAEVVVASPSPFGTVVTPAPTGTVVSPAPTPGLSAEPSAGPTAEPSPGPTASASPLPTPARTPDPRATASRLAIETLGIDLAVLAPAAGETRPRCGVAEFLSSWGVPDQRAATYLYANAVQGDFLPILQAVRKDARALVGQEVMVWSRDGFLWVYQIVSPIRRHETSLDWVYNLPPHSLVVQTADDGGKLMLVGHLVSQTQVAVADARPSGNPHACP